MRSRRWVWILVAVAAALAIGFLFERLIGWLGDRGPIGSVLIAVIGVATAVSLVRDLLPRSKGSPET